LSLHILTPPICSIEPTSGSIKLQHTSARGQHMVTAELDVATIEVVPVMASI
jgi:hypothetical protein